MLEVITAIFGIGKDIKSIIEDFQKKKKKTRGKINGILYEVLYNMSLIFEDYLETGDDPKNIAKDLKIDKLAQAIDDGFEFRQIKKGKISKKMVGNIGFLKPYVGYDCERFLINIRYHIDKLRRIPTMKTRKKAKTIDIKKRLENLGKRYLLFTKFLLSP